MQEIIYRQLDQVLPDPLCSGERPEILEELIEQEGRAGTRAALLSLQLIRAYTSEGRFNDAIRWVHRCESSPEFHEESSFSTGLRLSKAEVWQRMGCTDLAIRHLNKALSGANLEERGRIYHRLAGVYAITGSGREAIRAAEKALEYHVEDDYRLPGEMLLAQLHLEADDLDSALYHYELASELARNSDLERVQTGIALCHARRGDWRSSNTALEKADAIGNGEPALDLRVMRAECCVLAGRTDEALELIDGIIDEAGKQQGMLLQCLAMKRRALKQAGELDAAREVLLEEIRIKQGGPASRRDKRLNNVLKSQQESLIRMRSELSKLGQQSREIHDMHDELEKFAHITSHFVREPLRSISSFSSILQARYGKQENTEFEFYLGQIKEGVISIDLLLRDLLKYVSVGEKKEMFEAVDLNEVVAEMCRKMALSIEENNTTVNIDQLPVVQANKSMMLLLFQNLVNNAIKYRSSEDPVVHIRCHDQGDMWRLEVQDNGIGISKSYHQKIFKLFSRLDKSQKDGTGIGLATCKKVVSTHGGNIGLDSVEGQGSTFWFSLPKFNA